MAYTVPPKASADYDPDCALDHAIPWMWAFAQRHVQSPFPNCILAGGIPTRSLLVCP